MKSVSLFLLLLVPCLVQGQSGQSNQAIPYTLEDRDRAVRMEAKLDQYIAATDQRFLDNTSQHEAMRSEIKQSASSTRDTILWTSGVLGAIVAALLAFMFHDRRQASEIAAKPLLKRIENLEAELASLKGKLHHD